MNFRLAWDRLVQVYRLEGPLAVVGRFGTRARLIGRSLLRRLGVSKQPLLSLILYPKGGSESEAVEKLISSDLPARVEVLVVTSFSETYTRPNSRPNVRRLNLPHLGEVAALNTAVAVAQGHFVAFGIKTNEEIGALLAALPSAPPILGPANGPNESLGLEGLCIRRAGLIEAGLFWPEDGAQYVEEAISRIERGKSTSRLHPRVLYLVNGTVTRGGIRIVFEHCNRLRTAGVEAMIATLQEPIQDWFPLDAPLISWKDAPKTDVAVATYWTTAHLVANLDCPGFYFIQHDESLFHAKDWWTDLVRKTYRLPLEFITISKWLVELIEGETGRKAHLVPNGINREMFYPQPSIPKAKKKRILVEGNQNIFWKGMHEAEKALEGLDVEVWSLGDTGIRSDRTFAFPPQDELRGIYSSCDILLKTSWYEGMPLPHMEAMACGCALLTTNVPGVRDYCIDGWNCLMAEPKDVGSIRRQLRRLIDDDELREMLIANAFETAKTFDWEDKIDALSRIYRQASAEAAAGTHVLR